MAERGGDRGGRGFRARGDRRREEEKWVPVTKLGRLVKEGKIKTLEHIYLHSLPIKEHQIVDALVGPSLKDEVMKIAPVQNQTRLKAFVVVGGGNCHVGIGVKCSKEVATAIRGAIVLAKLSVVPVRRGYWGNKIGRPHTVPCKVTGKCGSVTVRMVPALGSWRLGFRRRCFSLLVLRMCLLRRGDGQRPLETLLRLPLTAS